MLNFFGDLMGVLKKLSWVNWNLVLVSKEKRGLAFGSLEAINLDLIQKWR